MIIIVLLLSHIIHIITDQSDESSTQQIVATRKQQINRVKKHLWRFQALSTRAKALSTRQDEETRKKVSTREKKNEIKRERSQEKVIRQKERVSVKKKRPYTSSKQNPKPTRWNPSHLLVTVAVRAGKSVHQVTEHRAGGNETEGKGVLQGHGVAALEVVGAVDLVLAGLAVHVLPDGPGAVDHGVVDVEDGVIGGGVEVLELGRATTDPVATTVDTELVVADVTLHQALEVLDGVLTDDEVG